MPQTTDILRARRRRRAEVAPWPGGIGILVLSLLIVALGMVIVAFALAFAELMAGVPPVESIEEIFATSGGEAFHPLQVYDREGERLLFTPENPAGEAKRWVSLLSGAGELLPPHVIQSTLAAQDPTYWANPGYERQALLQVLVGALLPGEDPPPSQTIAQRVVAEQLFPLGEPERPTWAWYLRSAMMAADLTRRYSKEQILEWYLNSAYYGAGAYGLDAAALVYFGKHAAELTLAESAMLASFSLEPASSPFDPPELRRRRQAEVLQTMVQWGMIDALQAEEAQGEALDLRVRSPGVTSEARGFEALVRERLEVLLGPLAMRRGGLRVISTLDEDLQMQADCAARTHQRRMAGEPVGVVEAADDGSACVAAGLLPTLRPGDAGEDHLISHTAVVVVDPARGEILSMAGSALEPRPVGTAFLPIVYLTAFSKGYSPGTMVLDIPPEEEGITEGAGPYQGPIRMRTALANGCQAAAERTLDRVGAETVLHTARALSLHLDPGDTSPLDLDKVLHEAEASLLDMVYAYGVVSNEGIMVGLELRSESYAGEGQSLEPVAILEVVDVSGRSVYRAEAVQRVVLSQALSYLLVDVLSDEAARWPSYGQPNALEIARPAGVYAGISAEGEDNWTLGFTPSRAVGAWVGNLGRGPMRGVTALNGATPIWHAVVRYANREMPLEGWSLPEGVVRMEVCDPSGLLPTEYCPRVVWEVFLQGTEPTHYDDLYQPFLVNRETGKLATLWTPRDLVEERVYVIPPPGASEWAEQAGVEQPPQEYDRILDLAPQNPEVSVLTPEPFETLRGEVVVHGRASTQDFHYYRLQYGPGLNPSRWVQIGQDHESAVEAGMLEKWDTAGLNGLYTLQLLVVKEGGTIATHAVPVTVDNQPPEIELLTPRPDEHRDLSEGEEVILEAKVSDNVAVGEVVFYVDGRVLGRRSETPYSQRWSPDRSGEYILHVAATDRAGNEAESERVVLRVNP